jgi:TraM recognition site of TraD and TraG
MTGHPTTGPTVRVGTGELALGGALLLLALFIAATDIAGAILTHSRPLGIGAGMHFLDLVMLHRSNPAAVWPGTQQAFSPINFWGLTAVLIALPAITAGVVIRRISRNRGDNRGFASLGEVRHAASLGAARRQAKVTRPSVTISGRTSRRLDAAEVGYPLGISSSPSGIELIASWEHSLQLVAPPGSGKTLRVLAPILRQHPGPALATSTKSDLYEVAVAARRRIGPVVALDPEGLCPASAPLRWSPIDGCEDARIAERRSAAFVAAAGDGADVRGGGFFRRSAAMVLAAYLHAAALGGGSMTDIVQWSARPRDSAPLRILATSNDRTTDWGARLHGHTSGAEETTSGVMRTVDLALGCFSDPAVLAACSPDSAEAFDFEKFFQANGTVFALGKDRGVGGVGPLITAFCQELIVAAENRSARLRGRRLDPPLLACLDEAPSIAPLPDLPALVADGRGRGIVVVLAMQSFSQAAERWGTHGAATIRNAASILAVFGGLSAAADLDELSRLCGKRHVERISISEGDSRRRGVSRHLAEEAVLAPAEIHSLPSGTALLFLGQLPPVLARLPGIWEGRAGKQIAAEEAAERNNNDAARAEIRPALGDESLVRTQSTHTKPTGRQEDA